MRARAILMSLKLSSIFKPQATDKLVSKSLVETENAQTETFLLEKRKEICFNFLTKQDHTS